MALRNNNQFEITFNEIKKLTPGFESGVGIPIQLIPYGNEVKLSVNFTGMSIQNIKGEVFIRLN